MSSENIAIRVTNLSKRYEIYNTPRDRLKQFVLPRLHRFLGMPAGQYFREFWALKDTSFEIKKGETVGIIGRNGSGKSTLLQMICGTVSATSGSVNTQGRIAALLELGAGFNSEFTGRENVLLNGAILGISQKEMTRRMESILAFSELGDFLDQPVKTYSSGMYARLAFSIAINVDPEILIVDEALAVGDARFVAKCMRRIKDIQKQGATILFVSHDVGSVRTLCGRVVWLDQGCLIEQGAVFPVTGRYMEFMFKDEETKEETVREEIVIQQKVESLASDVVLAGDEKTAVSTDSLQFASGMESQGPSQAGLDARPVTHWGSHKGLIISAAVLDEHGISKDVHTWGSVLNVVIEVCIPTTISREHLSIAFSIKDLKGTDLIVSTTRDFECKRLPDKECFSVSFRLVDPLVTGKYLLVAAVENRQYQSIHYYEYVEGAHYFSSLSNERFFGIFQPIIKQQIMEK
jgi:lipopolysaccharide transport system ATP-binding protein